MRKPPKIPESLGFDHRSRFSFRSVCSVWSLGEKITKTCGNGCEMSLVLPVFLILFMTLFRSCNHNGYLICLLVIHSCKISPQIFIRFFSFFSFSCQGILMTTGVLKMVSLIKLGSVCSVGAFIQT